MGESWIADAMELGLEYDPSCEYGNHYKTVRDKTHTSCSNSIQKANKRTKLFFEKQSNKFKEHFKLHEDEDNRLAIAHQTYSFIRVHHSKNELNKDYYLRIRMHDVDEKYKTRFDHLISEGRLLPPKKSYQRDHTLIINNKYDINENEIIPYVDDLIIYMSY